MAAGLFGVGWSEIIDFLLKFAPAASIGAAFSLHGCNSGTIGR